LTSLKDAATGRMVYTLNLTPNATDTTKDTVITWSITCNGVQSIGKTAAPSSNTLTITKMAAPVAPTAMVLGSVPAAITGTYFATAAASL